MFCGQTVTASVLYADDARSRRKLYGTFWMVYEHFPRQVSLTEFKIAIFVAS